MWYYILGEPLFSERFDIVLSPLSLQYALSEFTALYPEICFSVVIGSEREHKKCPLPFSLSRDGTSLYSDCDRKTSRRSRGTPFPTPCHINLLRPIYWLRAVSIRRLDYSQETCYQSNGHFIFVELIQMPLSVLGHDTLHSIPTCHSWI